MCKEGFRHDFLAPLGGYLHTARGSTRHEKHPGNGGQVAPTVRYLYACKSADGLARVAVGYPHYDGREVGVIASVIGPVRPEVQVVAVLPKGECGQVTSVYLPLRKVSSKRFDLACRYLFLHRGGATSM